MAEHRDRLMQTLRDLEASGCLGGLPKEPPAGFSKNARAQELLGLRPTNCTAFDQPCELGYHCPLCEYPHISKDGNYDERLHWSEYESMIWCSVCNVDYPSCLCLPPGSGRATDVFLASVGEAIGRRTPSAPAAAPNPPEGHRDRCAAGTGEEIPMHKFWMVYRVGHSSPTKMHETPQLALAEAKRLCVFESAPFIVLEAMARVEPAEPKAMNLRKPSNG